MKQNVWFYSVLYMQQHANDLLHCATPQAVSHWLLTTAAWVHV